MNQIQNQKTHIYKIEVKGSDIEYPQIKNSRLIKPNVITKYSFLLNIVYSVLVLISNHHQQLSNTNKINLIKFFYANLSR